MKSFSQYRTNLQEGVEEHEKLKDHTKNPYHNLLTQHGWTHQQTLHTKNRLAADNPRADSTVHIYTHPKHEGSSVTVEQEHDPTVGHGGQKSKGHYFSHRHKQENGIIAPSSGDSKPQLHRSLSYHYGVPKGMDAPPLTAWEKKYPRNAPNYKMNEESSKEIQLDNTCKDCGKIHDNKGICPALQESDDEESEIQEEDKNKICFCGHPHREHDANGCKSCRKEGHVVPEKAAHYFKPNAPMKETTAQMTNMDSFLENVFPKVNFRQDKWR